MNEVFTLLDHQLKFTTCATYPRPAEEPYWLVNSLTELPQNAHLLDAGCGCGILSLLLLQRFPTTHITGADNDKAALKRAVKNIATNNYAARFTPLHIDLTRGAPQGKYDIILSNPPFDLAYGTMQHDTPRAKAHAITPDKLMLWVQHLWQSVAPKGQLILILHTACLPLVKKGFGHIPHHIYHLQSHAARSPKRVIVKLGNELYPDTECTIPIYKPELRHVALYRPITWPQRLNVTTAQDWQNT